MSRYLNVDRYTVGAIFKTETVVPGTDICFRGPPFRESKKITVVQQDRLQASRKSTVYVRAPKNNFGRLSGKQKSKDLANSLRVRSSDFFFVTNIFNKTFLDHLNATIISISNLHLISGFYILPGNNGHQNKVIFRAYCNHVFLFRNTVNRPCPLYDASGLWHMIKLPKSVRVENKCSGIKETLPRDSTLLLKVLDSTTTFTCANLYSTFSLGKGFEIYFFCNKIVLYIVLY